MTFRTPVLVAALAAASWSLAPSVHAQAQDPSAQDPMSRETMPQDTMPQETMPQETMPQDTMPQETMPEESTGSPQDRQDPTMDDPSAPQAAPGAATESAALDDRKIEQFADAYLAVQTIQQKAAADLQTTSDPAQADKVKSDAESDMIAAVERSGLQVEEFNRIVETMAADVNVRSRIAEKLQERSGGT